MGDALLVNLLLPCPSITPFQARFSFSFLMPQSILSVPCYIYVWLHAYGLPGLKFLFIIFLLSLYSSFLLNCCGLFLKILFTLFLIEPGIKNLLREKMLSISQEVWYLNLKMLNMENDIVDVR